MDYKLLSAEELEDLWQQSGLSQDDFAASIGMSKKALESKLYRWRKKNQQRPRADAPDHQDADEKIEDDEKQNYRTVNYKGRICTLADLIEYCKIDLDVWEIERHVINKWEMGRRHEWKNIDYEDGKATGHVEDTGEVFVEPLFQIKVWLVRRVPVEVKPVIKPAQMQIMRLAFKPQSKEIDGYKKALLLSDVHFGFSRNMRTGAFDPFHDRRALDVCLQIAEDEQPDRIILMGDFLDLAEWSDKYLRSPDMYWTTQPAVFEFAWWLGQIRQSCPVTQIDYIEGNHENRMTRSMLTHLVAAYDLRADTQMEAPAAMSVENLLGLERMDVRYHGDYPNNTIWLNEFTRVIHGEVVRKGSGDTVKAVIRETTDNTYLGHIHRREKATKQVRTRDESRSARVVCPGCLCRIDGMVPGSGNQANWQQGAAMVYYNETDCRDQLIEIEDGTGVFNGIFYRAREEGEIVPELARDTGWRY